ncbi:MAG TPA: hypothetical protein VIT00_08400 [Terrimicrobiaceae bacterium]
MSATVASAPARKQIISERQKRSAVWRIIHLLGSLQLALILLATIAIACAIATFAESNFNTKIAQTYIYKAPWFQIWLAVLCVNLFAVTLTRWPWQKRHIGFVVTHYGIITLLIGAMIGMQTGFEGNVTLRKDTPPVNRITTSRSIIQLQSPADSALYLMRFDAEATRPSARRPRSFPVPGTDLKVVADDFSPNLIREQRLVASESPNAGQSVLLKLSSSMAGQAVDVPLSLDRGQAVDRDFFGLARISFRHALSQPSPAVAHETQMVFAHYAPISQSQEPPSGVTVRLSEDGSKVTIISPEGTGATYLRSEIMNQPVAEAGAWVSVENYWPDFVMNNGQPTSKSDSPNNPAALVRISKHAETKDAKPALELATAGDGIVYQLRRGEHVIASGSAKPGDSFALGWADWQAEVIQSLQNAELVTEVKAGPPLQRSEQGLPGFRAHLESSSGNRGADRWIESGQITALTDGNHVVRIGYGLEAKSVPFSLRLVNFEVPRDEGTDTPSNFLATIEFRDPTTGATKIGVARMNHPASYPGTLLASLTGINYKFSQAEWNPRDLGETTLQVLYDPGWLLKWIGSLAICVGIAIMFYWRPGDGRSRPDTGPEGVS